MRFSILIFILLVLFNQKVTAQDYPTILKEKDRAELIDEILEDRMQNLLPKLMRAEGIDMWVIISREYNEDPVMKTMLPSVWLAARRRTIFVFFDNGKEVERFAIARYDVGTLLKGEWDLNTYPDQWDALLNTIKAKNPKKIALNFSKNYGHADGLTHTEHQELMSKFTELEKKKIVSAENLAVSWLETRTEKEMAIYENIGRISHKIIDEAFSEKVIQPGYTTTEDVVWWMRQKVTDLGLETWFHPTVDIQRASMDGFNHLKVFSKRPEKEVIMHGDFIHCDFGISYLRLNTDHQEIAYILKPTETEIPKYLVEAFKEGNRLQEILTENFKIGLSGNQILANALTQSKKENIKGTIYTHPIGLHGHAAGPTIGMWDNQGPTIGPGDYPLKPNTAYSIELNAVVELSEWKKPIRVMLEQNGIFNGEGFRYIDGRQKEIMKIPRK